MPEEEIAMDYQSFLELVKKRRSIRRFKPDPVPDEYIDKIIEAARWAPSGFNLQPWEFVVVKDKELKDSIVEFSRQHRTQSARLELTREPWQKTASWYSKSNELDYAGAPVFILLFGDARTQVGLPMFIRFDPSIRQSILTSSLANAFLYMHLAATTLGLASQWVSSVGIPAAHCLIKDLLGIPQQLEIYDMMAVGYPAVEPRGKLMRAKDEMVHHDYCGGEDFRTDEEVKDFIKRTRTWVVATMKRQPDRASQVD
jgi:nitroreductase